MLSCACSITDYAMAGDHVYCKTHYMELFRQRGKYEFAPDTLPPPVDPSGMCTVLRSSCTLALFPFLCSHQS